MSASKSTGFDSIPESYQEYIVTIYRLSSKTKQVSNIEIAKKMGNAPSSVYNMLKKLAYQKLISWEPRQKEIILTSKGEEIGKQLILGHLIIELFLREYLGLTDEDQIHNIACKMEHHITEPIKEGFRNKIGEETYRNLESIVKTESDPEKTIKLLKEIFPTPIYIITKFAELLGESIPGSKEIIDQMKNKYIKQL